MNKKNIIFLVGIGIVTYSLLIPKKKKYSTDEQLKITKYKKYLEEKDFVIVDKKKYNKIQNKKIFKLSSIPNYYAFAKTIAKIIL